MLCGRGYEKSVIERLLGDAVAGGGGALIVRGEPGIGKTALLDHAVAAAEGIRIIRATGIEAEADLPFAALHLLLRPVLDRADGLPEPQRLALRGAFGLAPVTSADRFLIGLAVLSLLSEVAEDRPLLCVIDDAHWLDRASADALLFAARRLGSDGIVLLFATRDAAVTPGLDEVRLAALSVEDSAALLSGRAAELSPMARYRILAEAAGNPLALLELPTEASPTGDFPLTQRVQDAFHAQVERLPEQARLLLLVAASDPSPDLEVVLAAGKVLGASPEALDAAEGLIRVSEGVVAFRHPLVRAAVYRGAPPVLRLAVHAALAETLISPADADRRAWHLASAATGPDERAAAELERTAVRAGERSGFGSAAVAYARAARLTSDRTERTRRNVLAAEAAVEAGDLDLADELAEMAARQAAPPQLRTRIAMTRSTVNSARGRLRTAHGLLLEAADLEPEGSIWSLMGSMFLAWNSGENDLASRTLERLTALRPAPDDPLTPVLQLTIWSVNLQLGLPSTGLPPLPEVTRAALRLEISGLPALMLIRGAGLAMGHDAKISELSAATVSELRAQGRIGLLPAALTYLATAQVLLGQYGEALSNAEEGLRIARDTSQAEWAGQASSILAYVAAIQGDEQRCASYAETAGSVAVAASRWSLALLDLGYGRAEQALSQLDSLAANAMHCQLPVMRSTPDLIEAAVRVGQLPSARAALARFEAWAARIGLAWSDALVARCQALVDGLEEHYVTALKLHAQDNRLFDQARTHLLYGEWLRRARRKADARGHLQTALNTFEHLGAVPWSDRARAELNLIGMTTTPARSVDAVRLTPQELQIVRLAAQGMSNRDIAAQLFLSHRTVGHHLYKAYPKLGIATRGELTTLDLA
ncbi:AAA family ATPase [Streptosporangium sp. CA-135522]|uniref:helix-turn-helix transcriptional regulator n=1 Tax=Streptosporangium sp. CA-135522 TaxID=3240072 RepID=UPI003D8AAA13